MMNQVMRLFKEEEGQALTEYGLLVGLISIAVIATLLLIGPQLKIIFDQILTALGGTAPK
ncbi:Flp family type IVb pilin [Lederbergia citri]|uniref:Flp family type IVb pilin n=1 Tax=Lederbergia citri TaxID=2833580 RepID=A0A942TED2_9BACI|nr:Flp family type IVb pilin [Lederbergia citri]MBS4196148.1 Flp family type IVb pilin [Lederbergia citri]